MDSGVKERREGSGGLLLIIFCFAQPCSSFSLRPHWEVSGGVKVPVKLAHSSR